MTHLERALDNQNQWWKYLVMFLAAIIGAEIIGAIPLIAVIGYKTAQNINGPTFSADNLGDLSVYGIPPNVGLLLLILPSALGLVVLSWLLRPLHNRTLKETINGTATIRWGRALYAAAVWGLLLGIYLLIDYSLHPKNFELSFNSSSFIPLVLTSVILFPFQTSFEEVFFRGYLAQGIAARTRMRWLAIIIPAILFALMHVANPEVTAFGFWLAMPQYVLFGLVFGLIATLDDGIETAIGAHAANNIFASVFVTYKSSVIQTPALFNQLEVDPVKETWSLVIISVVFVAVLAFKYKWRFSVLNKKVQYRVNAEGQLI